MYLKILPKIMVKSLTVVIISFSLSACTTLNPATGGRDFTPFMSPAKEMSLGKEAHPGILKDNGGVYKDDKVNGYVAAIGGRLVAASELKNYPFHFTVLDTPLVNAFALPGGYVYVTRGILAMVNSEAELASVIGHEIGHVTARHSAKRYNNQMFAGLGSVLFGAVTGNNALTNSLNQASQVYLMSYSRNQEHQSDELGIRYSNRAGFDPYAAADMLKSLDADRQLQLILSDRAGQPQRSDFFSTHPNTESRIARAAKAAQNTQVPYGSRGRNKDLYFNMIDGMAWGNDPNKGMINGTEFIHPVMRFKFLVPENYTLINSDDAIMAKGTGSAKGSLVLFAGSNNNDQNIMTYASEIWQGYKINNDMENIQEININNMPAITGFTRGIINKENYIIRLVAIKHSTNSAYHFLILSPENKNKTLSESLQRMTYSFDKLTAREASAIKGRHIRIIKAKDNDTIESLAQNMAFDDYKVERFVALNGLTKGQPLTSGEQLKIIVME